MFGVIQSLYTNKCSFYGVKQHQTILHCRPELYQFNYHARLACARRDIGLCGGLWEWVCSCVQAFIRDIS